jgi:peroxiredoxin
MRSDSIIPLAAGSPAPDFALPDAITGQMVSPSTLAGTGVVLVFWSVECPWTRHYDDYFLDRAALWAEHGIALVMVISNAGEDIEVIRDMADAYGLTNLILHDEGNDLANAYGAQTTPHAFVIDGNKQIIYQGSVDNRTFRQQEPTINYLDAAVEALVNGQFPEITETPAFGDIIVRA